MKIIVTGSSGLIGSALMVHLMRYGHDAVGLTRVFDLSENTDNSPSWDIESGEINWGTYEAPDVVIHLAGESIANGRWTTKKKERIIRSRVNSTELLVESFRLMKTKPKLFICASAIGFYGDRPGEVLDESSSLGSNFVADVSQQWEAASSGVEALGIRLVNLRFGVVLSPDGGALKEMLLPFKFGLGGVIGSGNQYFSWVALNDVLRAIDFILTNEQVVGPVNLVAPNPVTNRVFTQRLAAALKRPALLPMPTQLARLIFGEVADELLLSSARVLPKKLSEHQFTFESPELDEYLNRLFNA